MKNHAFFNIKFKNIQDGIAADYDRQARQFQAEYNKKHPGRHIWRHILYRRTFCFFNFGQTFPVTLEIVRFIYAGTNKTFTFYGSLFLPFSHFSKDFMALAVSEPSGDAALEVSESTVRCWARHLKQHNLASGYIHTSGG